MTGNVSPKVGYLVLGGQGMQSERGWFFWPSDTASLIAAMTGALYGPYETEEEAMAACDGLWFELEEPRS